MMSTSEWCVHGGHMLLEAEAQGISIIIYYNYHFPFSTSGTNNQKYIFLQPQIA